MRSTENNQKYQGVRPNSKGDKWCSEIRVPRSPKRIWLGTFKTPEMAATAHDVAASALQGERAVLNFPANLRHYAMPASLSDADIKAAAILAASAFMRANSSGGGTEVVVSGPYRGSESSDSGGVESSGSGGASGGGKSIDEDLKSLDDEVIDEEELFYMPKLMVDMACGMLVSPPKIYLPSSDEEGNSDGGDLW